MRMEVQFSKMVYPCLRTLTSGVQTQEQTQDVRLPDGMPDIGRILACWGQPLIRGKEWHSTGMLVSGGVMAWVLYAPEDGSEARCVDAWIPFQVRWDFPEAQRDGTICVSVAMENMDARCISARKMLVRATVQVMGEAMEPSEVTLYRPEQLPEDVMLRQMVYPVQMPQEAGEKQFQLEETLPAPTMPIHKLLRYQAQPQIAEQRVMTNRLIFRGSVEVSALYQDESGALREKQWSVPFSQFTELDRDYVEAPNAWILPVITSLDLERGEQGDLNFRCGIACQYVIYDRSMLHAVEDAYSNHRKVELLTQEVTVPGMVERRTERLQLRAAAAGEGSPADAVWNGQIPQVVSDGDTAEFAFPGQFQLLYHDGEGVLQGATARAEAGWQLGSAAGNRFRICCLPAGKAEATPGLEGMELRQELSVETQVLADTVIPMVTGLELGERMEADPERPSLILMRAGDESLWEMAKSCGSTVEAITKANSLTGEPEKDRMLLIPVI